MWYFELLPVRPSVFMSVCTGAPVKQNKKRIRVGGMDLFFREMGGDSWQYI